VFYLCHYHNNSSSCCCFERGTSLRAINHNSSSCCVFTKGSLRAINHNSSSCCVFERGSSAINHNSFRFTKRHSSVLSITTHHHCERHVLCAINHNSFLFSRGTSLRAINHNSSCVLKGARPSVLSITTHHQCHERHVLRAINHNTSCCFHERHVLRAINHNSSSCCVFTQVLRAINHNSSSCCFHRHVPPCYQSSSCCVFTKGARPSVLSITTHRHVRLIARPPCYQSITTHHQFSRGTSSVHQSQLIVMLCFHERHVLRAINHNSSSCCVFTKARPPCYQSQLSSCCFHEARPPCYQSQLIIMLCFHERARPSVSTTEVAHENAHNFVVYINTKLK
jgi:hypothetical protein